MTTSNPMQNLITSQLLAASGSVTKAGYRNKGKIQTQAAKQKQTVKPQKPVLTTVWDVMPEREPIPSELMGEAKRRVRAEYGVDPEAHGWHGLVLYAVDAIRLEREGEASGSQAKLI